MPGLQPGDELGHRRQPLGDQLVAERGPEEALEADEQPGVVLVPAEALAAGVAVRQLVDGRPHRGEHLEAGGHEGRAVLVGQDQRVLGGQREGLRGRVVGHVAGGRLRGEPLAHVALGVAEPLRQLGAGAAGVRRQAPPEAEPVAQVGEHRVVADAEVVDDLRRERLDLGLVDRGRRRPAAPRPGRGW